MLRFTNNSGNGNFVAPSTFVNKPTIHQHQIQLPVFTRFIFPLIAVAAIMVGLYPAVYFFVDGRFGLLATKSDVLLDSRAWNLAFHTHIIWGGIALLTGWSQFVGRWRVHYPHLHRRLGKLYVVAVSISGLAALYIGIFATGGWVPSAGFIGLGLAWLGTTLAAWSHIRKKRIAKHRVMMIYSYAACLAAVTLRIYLPILVHFTGSFEKAYPVVAWLCWVPNLVAAYFITKQFKPPGNFTRSIPAPRL